jgi:MurNAc alpha-1-phosphate uridylyltransferase
MILAAGKGERMMPLTKDMPKPLLKAGGQSLIEHLIHSLVSAGISDIIINTARFGYKIEEHLGACDKWQAKITYSHEGEKPAGTGGGVQRALPLLGPGAFILINGDIWTDYDFKRLKEVSGHPVHLIMVENPSHHKTGDFCLEESRVSLDAGKRYTYSGIGLYQPELFYRSAGDIFSFVPMLKQEIQAGRVTGEVYTGQWFDIGTPERLKKLQEYLEK